jgi:hypothetical protein
VQIAQMIENYFDVENSRVDGGRVMRLVLSGFVEKAPDLGSRHGRWTAQNAVDPVQTFWPRMNVNERE